jgi:hypothetical protein
MSNIWSPENAGSIWVATMAFGVLFFAFWIFLQSRLLQGGL